MRHIAIAVLLVTIVLSGATLSVAAVDKSTADLPMSEIHNREIIIELDLTRSGKSVSAFCQENNVSLERSVPLTYAQYEVVSVPENADYHQVYQDLVNNPNIKTIGPNVKKRVSQVDYRELIKQVSTTVLDDPMLLGAAETVDEALQTPAVRNNQYALHLTNCLKAWDHTTGDNSIVVAVLDTGANFNHEDMQGRFWVNTDEIAGNDTDDDNNGYVDDVNGYDFHNISSTGGDSDPTDPSDDLLSHGVATASIIAARGNNQLGIAGVAGGNSATSGVRIMTLRVGTNSDIGVDAEIAALDYASANGAHIVSMSFGGASGGPPEENAINRAWNNGLYVVAASGNSGQGNGNLIDLPAGFDNCVAVGATTIFPSQNVTGTTAIIPEEVAGYSKTGPETEVVAPGTHILCAMKADDGYSNLAHQFTGTSAATPIVAGLAALLWSADIKANGGITKTNNQIREIINTTAIDMGDTGRDEIYGFGRIDMYKAIQVFFDPDLVGDANRDGVVDEDDLQVIINNFGNARGEVGFNEAHDTNGDGVVDELDIFAIGRQFGQTTED